MAVLLIGCHRSYITQEIFIQELSNAYGIDDSTLLESQIDYHPNQNIKTTQAIELIEYLNDEPFTTSIHSTYLTATQAKELINEGLQIYLEDPVSNQEEVELKNYITLYDYTKVEDHHYQSTEKVSIGDLILVDEIMQRVVKVEGEDIYSEDVNFEDVVESLDIDEEVSIDEEDIELEDGITYANSTMANKGLNLSLKVNLKKGSLSLCSDVNDFMTLQQDLSIGNETSYKDGSLSLIPTSNNYGSEIYSNYKWIKQYQEGNLSLSELKKKLQVKEEKEASLFTAKYDSGYSIKGTIALSNITIHPKINYDVTGLHRLSIGLNYDIETKLEYKGKIQEKIKIATIKVPVGQIGLKVAMDLYLNFTGNGEVKLTLKHSDVTKVEYKEGVTKKVNAESTDISGDAALKLSVGPAINLGIDYLGMKITDLELDVDARLKPYTSLSLNTQIEEDAIHLETYFKYGVNAYVPIITLKSGTKSSLAYRCGLTIECKLKDEEHSNKYKLYENNMLLYENKIPLLDSSDSLKGKLDLSSYYLFMNIGDTTKLSITSLPQGYTEDDLIFEVEDTSILSMNKTTLTALKEGVTTYHVSTSDRLYECQCVIQVARKEEQL